MVLALESFQCLVEIMPGQIIYHCQLIKKIDRVLMSSPLLLNTNSSSVYNSHKNFKFKLGWLLRDGFVDMVKEIWSNVVDGNTLLEHW